MTDTPNYPDILGYITGGARCNIHVVQLALGVRPRVVRAGRPFEAVLLVQNASDVNVDLSVNLSLPERDARKQKGMFKSGKTRLVVGLRPAEAGYVQLPVMCQPDTAPGDEYRIHMEVSVKPLEKPGRIRLAEGGGKIPFESLPADAREQVETLKKLNFSTTKRFGLRDSLEVSFGVMPGRLGQITRLQPGWVHLWGMSDHVDNDMLLARYGPQLRDQALPLLNRANVFRPLVETTLSQFAEAGYSLRTAEAVMIAKVLTYVLEMAAPREDVLDHLANPAFNVRLALDKWASANGGALPDLPYWFSGLVYHVARSEELMRAPAQVVSKILFLDLLRDVIPHAFSMIKIETGENMGTPAEIQQYTDQIIARLENKQGMDFTHAYMPLVLAGIIVHDRITMKGEEMLDTLRATSEAVQDRIQEVSSDEMPVLDITRELINRHTRQFGFEI